MLTYSLFFCKRKPLISKDVGKEHRSCCNLCSLQLSFSSLTCRKCASTMFMYMSSSSLPLPMKHRCSPLAMEPDSKDCFWASRRDFTERANSEGFWSICEKKGKYTHYFMYIFIFSIHLNTEAISSALTRSESRWKAVDRCPELYCSAGRQSTTKKRTPSWK